MSLTVLLLSGCGTLETVGRLRQDFMAQSLVKQAESRVLDGRADGRAVQLAVWATELAPGNRPVLRAATRVFLRGRAWDRAVLGMLTLGKKSGAVDLYELGACYLYLGQEERGSELVEGFLSLERSRHVRGQISDFGLAGALNNVGYAYADSGVRLRRALELTQEAVRLAPANALFLDSLGWAQFRLGQYERAAFALEQALRLERQESAEILYHAGACHARLGRLLLARRELRRAISLRHNDFPEAADELRRMRWQLPPPQTA